MTSSPSKQPQRQTQLVPSTSRVKRHAVRFARYPRAAMNELPEDVLAFDIETTGLPRKRGWDSYFEPHKLAMYDTSRVVSVAFEDTRGFQRHTLIRPEGFEIANSHIHGITTERARTEGVTLRECFDASLIARIKSADALLAHNVLFDVYVLASELWRQGMKDVATVLLDKARVCTGLVARIYFRSRYMPKLVVLYGELFGQAAVQQVQWHDASSDARACLACYRYMRTIMRNRAHPL